MRSGEVVTKAGPDEGATAGVDDDANNPTFSAYSAMTTADPTTTRVRTTTVTRNHNSCSFTTAAAAAARVLDEESKLY
jgi:hypothetical protein